VQVDRRSGIIRNHDGVIAKFGVPPRLIPDYLALVGDSADGYPGIAGYGAKTAARLLNAHGPIEDFPPELLKGTRADALLFKKLATLVVDAPLFENVDELEWRGATAAFPAVAEKIDPRLLERVTRLTERLV